MARWGAVHRTRVLTGSVLVAAVCACGPDHNRPACVEAGQAHSLGLPSDVGREQYLETLAAFLTSFEYRTLGWCEDKGTVRDTGPYINGAGYQGTHPPVHMAYSPQALDWLLNGRQANAMPDGALIIKEQWYSVEVDGAVRSGMPAAAFENLSRNDLDDLLRAGNPGGSGGWTTMIKDSAGSTDGWFWAEIDAGSQPNDPNGFNLLSINFGSPCARCHASAEVESTFIDTQNIAGFPGAPETYEIQDGWRTQPVLPPSPDDPCAPSSGYVQTPDYAQRPLAFVPWLPGTCTLPAPVANSVWLQQYPSIPSVTKSEVRVFPPASLDHVPHPPGDQYYVTADQCLGCHGGLEGLGNPMFEPNAVAGDMGTDISPSGDWRFTPMGLAGRDPIFYSQLETEVAMVAADYPSDAAEVEAFKRGAVETCMGCHGGPGVRQAHLDGVEFQEDFVYLSDPREENFKYGALARDGINCAMCHHIGNEGTEAEFFRDYTTGRYITSAPDVIYGPFADNTIHPKPMEHGVGFSPEHASHFADSSVSSRLCGHCHTINLPVVDAPKIAATPPSQAFPIAFNSPDYPFPIHAEQSTYTEWLNSEFQTVFGEASQAAQSCQSCHMDKSFLGDEIDTIIASIQDESYPAIEHLLPDLLLEPRTNYGRHQFVGLNVPLLQMFNQFYDILGVNKQNYMTGLSTAINNTIATMLTQAAERTIDLEVTARVENEQVVADVALTNLTGHRFPSGVAFRRAWLEVLLVNEATSATLWGSGRTNEVGVIVDGAGAPLATEFFTDNVWQPHYESITAETEVQIYEEVALDRQGTVTYSFLRRDTDPKDNRLLPKGWTARGPSDTISEAVIESTHPKGSAAGDPSYLDGSGRDTITYRMPLPDGLALEDISIKASVYYQSTSPAFLQEKFRWSPDGQATLRLYYLMSNLDTQGSAMEGWKVLLKSQQASVQL